MWEHNNVKYWNGDKLRILEGATLIRLGGHFSGGQILHWTEGASGKGVILTADILQVISSCLSLLSTNQQYVLLPIKAPESDLHTVKAVMLFQ
jgi:hypothetical protein